MTTTVDTNNGAPVKWAGTGLGPTVITWSLATANIPSQSDEFRKPPAFSEFITPASLSTYLPPIQQAFAAWAKLANVAFVQVPDSAIADIRIGFANLMPQFIGHVAFEFDGQNHFSPGTVLQIENPLETAVTPSLQYITGTTVLQDLVSQIGRALGLNGSADDPASIVAPTLGMQNLVPDAGDIAAIQSLYGRPDTNPMSLASVFNGANVSLQDFAPPTMTASMTQHASVGSIFNDPPPMVMPLLPG